MDLYAKLRALDVRVQRGTLTLLETLDEYRKIVGERRLSREQLTAALTVGAAVTRTRRRE